MVPVVLTAHARKRLEDERQAGVDIGDVLRAARSLPGRLPFATRIRNLTASSGKKFDIAVVDRGGKRFVVTVIGK